MIDREIAEDTSIDQNGDPLIGDTHVLKTWPNYFEKLKSGVKTFEIRRKDRDYKLFDILHLKEWDNKKLIFTQRELFFRVIYIADVAGIFPEMKDIVVMSISRM